MQKILATAGYGSRRACEKIIEEGHVIVNGKVAQIGQSACPKTDDIVVYGKQISGRIKEHSSSQTVVLAVHKPRGVVSAMKDPQGRPCLSDYCPPSYPRMFHVGRLDINSEGLIFLTNDGDWSQQIAHPSKELSKLYHVVVTAENVHNGSILDIPDKLMRSVSLDDGPARVIRAQWISVPTAPSRSLTNPQNNSFPSSPFAIPSNGKNILLGRRKGPNVYKDEMESLWLQNCDSVDEPNEDHSLAQGKLLGDIDSDLVSPSELLTPGIIEPLMMVHKYRSLDDRNGMRVLHRAQELSWTGSDATVRPLNRNTDEDNLVSAGILEIELSEGRHRIVRRMMESVDLKVRRLMRMAIGGLGIGRKSLSLTSSDKAKESRQNLKKIIALGDPGNVVRLTPEEIDCVLHIR